MLPYDEFGKNGVSTPLPDKITIKEPKEDTEADIIQNNTDN